MAAISLLSESLCLTCLLAHAILALSRPLRLRKELLDEVQVVVLRSVHQLEDSHHSEKHFAIHCATNVASPTAHPLRESVLALLPRVG